MAAGFSLAAALVGGLLVAEQRSAPQAIKTQSIAAHSVQLPVLPTSPNLTTISPMLGGLMAKGPSTSASPSLVHGQFFPVLNPVCAALLIERDALLAGPQGPATDTALAVNAAALAFFHCIPISGQPF